MAECPHSAEPVLSTIGRSGREDWLSHPSNTKGAKYRSVKPIILSSF